MAYFLFIDESGQDHQKSPYEVLAGVAVHDTRLWDFIRAIQRTEIDVFGGRITRDSGELKARKLLNRQSYRLAAQLAPIADTERRELANEIIGDGTAPTRKKLTALGQARIAFVGRVLDLCPSFGVHAFASIVTPDAPKPPPAMLRKDYAYLFQRFFYFLDDQPDHERGLVIFDEIGRSGAHMLINQMSQYFVETAPGRARASRVIPEPFFVRSDLTSCVQVADLVAYIISWAVRFNPLTAPVRSELTPLADKVMAMRYRALRDVDGYDNFVVWSFKEIFDLRPSGDRGFEIT